MCINLAIGVKRQTQESWNKGMQLHLAKETTSIEENVEFVIKVYIRLS